MAMFNLNLEVVLSNWLSNKYPVAQEAPIVAAWKTGATFGLSSEEGLRPVGQ